MSNFSCYLDANNYLLVHVSRTPDSNHVFVNNVIHLLTDGSEGFAPAAGPFGRCGLLGCWQYSDRLGGLLAWCFFVGCLFCEFISVAMCVGSLLCGCSFPFCLFVLFGGGGGAFAVASLQPMTTARCFKTVGANRFVGLLGCWVFVVWFRFDYFSLLTCVLARWLLGVSSQSSCYFRSRKW